MVLVLVPYTYFALDPLSCFNQTEDASMFILLLMVVVSHCENFDSQFFLLSVILTSDQCGTLYCGTECARETCPMHTVDFFQISMLLGIVSILQILL